MNQEIRTYPFQDFLAMEVKSLLELRSRVRPDNTSFEAHEIYDSCKRALFEAGNLLILAKLDYLLAKKLYSASVDAFIKSLSNLKSNQQPVYYTCRPLLAGLLSDDSQILYRVGDDQLNKYYKEPKPCGPITFNLAQHALNQNYDANFESLINVLAPLERKLKNEGRGFSHYFLALAGKDVKKCQVEINKLIQDEPKKDMASFGPNYYNMEITGFVKLAHHNGLMVDIEHPMIDKRLLAFESLDAYPDCLEAIELLAPFHKPRVWVGEVPEEVPDVVKEQEGILKRIGKWLRF